MRILVACEFSGTVRDAFARRGHDAWSCDLLPSEQPGQHIRGNAIEASRLGWDLMIAHPPCRYLSRAGAMHMHKPGRQTEREHAMEFFLALWRAPVQRIAIENPVGYPWRAFRPPDQTVNPYEFGHGERKKTCLWLKRLPPLFATILVDPPAPHFICANGKALHFVDAQPSGRNRWKVRSRTFPGIAEAMADQWGGDVESRRAVA